MNWSDLAPALAPVAPTLGKLIGGTLPIPFGSAIGAALGSAVADAMGVPVTPEAVSTALGATHNDVLRAQLGSIEAQAVAQWQSLAQQITAEATVGAAQVQSVSEVQRAELVSGEWYQRWWRPLAMYIWIGTWPIQLGEILWHISTKDPAAIANLAQVITALSVWNAGPAALAGIYSWNRSQEKIAAQTNGT